MTPGIAEHGFCPGDASDPHVRIHSEQSPGSSNAPSVPRHAFPSPRPELRSLDEHRPDETH